MYREEETISRNRKFKIDDIWARNMSISSNMDFCMEYVKKFMIEDSWARNMFSRPNVD